MSAYAMLNTSLPMKCFVILLRPMTGDFTCQCGRLGRESVLHYLINTFPANNVFYYFTLADARRFCLNVDVLAAKVLINDRI